MTKKIIYSIVLQMLLCLYMQPTMQAQNLVQNGSFEDYVLCPAGNASAWVIEHWWSAGGTLDYFNACAPTYVLGDIGVSTPLNLNGYQPAEDGVAYYGGLIMRTAFENQREYLGTELIDPLTPGVRYYLSFYTSRAIRNYQKAAAANIGAALSMNYFKDTTEAVVFHLPPKVNMSAIVYDTTNWTLVSGSFIADSAYRYLYLGNFYNDAQTPHEYQQFPDIAYYYIDQVKFSSDSNFVDLSVADAQEICTVGMAQGCYSSSCPDNPIELLEVFDLSGKLLHRTIAENNTACFNEKLKGCYLLSVTFRSGYRKFLKLYSNEN